MKFLSKVFVGILVLFGLSVFFGTWYTIDEGERGVRTRAGAVIGTAEPGLHFKLPFIDGVRIFSVQSRVRTYEGMHTYSRDQQPTILFVSLNYRMPADQVETVYTNYGSEEALIARLLDRQVNEEVKTVFGRFNAIAAVQERGRLNLEVAEAIQRAVVGPVLIEGVQIENIDFSEAYEQSIEQRMLAEVEVERIRQNAEREKINAEIAVTQARGRADSVRAEAEAQADAIRLRGEAEATAIRARAAALADNPLLIQLTAAERWNGTLPSTMVPGGAVPFVNVGADR